MTQKEDSIIAAAGGGFDTLLNRLLKNPLLVEESADTLPDSTSVLNLSVKNKLQCTALHVAAFGGHWRCVEALLRKNTDIKAQNDRASDATPLPTLDLESRDVDGTTPFAFASLGGHLQCLEILYEYGADVNTISGNSSALIGSSLSGHTACCDFILKHCKDDTVDAQTDTGQTARMQACTGGHMDVIKMLLAKGANIELCILRMV